MHVKDIMSKEVQTVTVDYTVEECARHLLEHHFSGIPVLDAEGKLAGIVTEGDLIKRASHFKVPAVLELLGGFIYLDSPNKYIKELKKAMSERVGDMMSGKIVTVKPDDTVEDAATIMLDEQIKRLPVMDPDGELIGIVSRRDIMRYLYAPPEKTEL